LTNKFYRPFFCYWLFFIFVGERLGYVALILVLYGWAIIPLMYIFSFLFSVPTTAFTRMTILNVCTGLAALLVIFILGILNKLDVRDVFKWIFLFLPNYNLGQAMVDLSTNYMFISAFSTNSIVSMCSQYARQAVPQLPRDVAHQLCELTLKSYNGKGKISISQCESDLKAQFKFSLPYDKLCELIQSALDKSTEFFQWDYLAWKTPGIGRYLVFLAFEGLLFFGVVLLIEYKVFQRLFRFLFRSPAVSVGPPAVNRMTSVTSEMSNVMVDSDVQDEQDRVLGQENTGDALLMKAITKVFKVQGVGQWAKSPKKTV